MDYVPTVFDQVELAIRKEVSCLLSLGWRDVAIFRAMYNANRNIDFLMRDSGLEIAEVILESNIKAFRIGRSEFPSPN